MSQLGGHRSMGLWLIGALILPSVLAAGLPAAGLSSGPSVGPDLRINLPGDGEAAPNCNTQNEVSLARFGDSVVAGWNDLGQCDKVVAHRELGGYPLGFWSISGYGYSSNGGNTWTDGGVLTPPNGGHLAGDPVLAAGPDGTFYYATLMTTEGVSKIGVARSTDGGRTWSPPVNASLNATPTSDPPRWPSGALQTFLQDKPWIYVDVTQSSYRGYVYVAWTEFLLPSDDPADPPPSTLNYSVLFARSVDGGRTFGNPVKLDVPARYGIGTQVAVGPEGDIYVAWLRSESGDIFVARSLDGGTSFLPQQQIAQVVPIGENHVCLPGETNRLVLNGDIRVQNWPSMAVDVSGSSDPRTPDYNPYRGRIYVAVPHETVPGIPGDRLHDESDIYFIYSSDGGITWKNVGNDVFKTPQFILSNPDPSQTDQFHPQVAVDSEGRVAVSWYDRRVSRLTLPNWDMAMFATVSTDGGETFGPNFQVGDVPFPPSRTNPNTNLMGGCYMGEYNGMAAGDGEFLLAWGDNRDQTVGITDPLPDPNVYFDRITLHDPLATDDSATTANGIPVTINVLRNDSDPNGDPLTVTGVTQPAHGTSEINPDDTVTYDPVCGFQGIDTFSYTISDGQGGSDTGLVSVRARRTTRRTTMGC